MKRIHLLSLCLMAMFAFGAVAASSSMAVEDLLWEIESGHNFPVKITGTGGATKLETVGKKTVNCTGYTVTGEIGGMAPEAGTKFAHLFLILIHFTKCKTTFFTGGPCKTSAGAAEEIQVTSIIGHLGLAHLGTNLHIPGVVLLIPPGFEFECTVFGVKKKVAVKGQVIGEITNPNIGTFEKGYNFKFHQASAGKQELTEFLVSLEKGTLLTGLHENSKAEGEAEEESAQEGEGPVEGTTGEPNIRLVQTVE